MNRPEMLVRVLLATLIALAASPATAAWPYETIVLEGTNLQQLSYREMPDNRRYVLADSTGVPIPLLFTDDGQGFGVGVPMPDSGPMKHRLVFDSAGSPVVMASATSGKVGTYYWRLIDGDFVRTRISIYGHDLDVANGPDGRLRLCMASADPNHVTHGFVVEQPDGTFTKEIVTPLEGVKLSSSLLFMCGVAGDGTEFMVWSHHQVDSGAARFLRRAPGELDFSTVVLPPPVYPKYSGTLFAPSGGALNMLVATLPTAGAANPDSLVFGTINADSLTTQPIPLPVDSYVPTVYGPATDADGRLFAPLWTEGVHAVHRLGNTWGYSEVTPAPSFAQAVKSIAPATRGSDGTVKVAFGYYASQLELRVATAPETTITDAQATLDWFVTADGALEVVAQVLNAGPGGAVPATVRIQWPAELGWPQLVTTSAESDTCQEATTSATCAMPAVGAVPHTVTVRWDDAVTNFLGSWEVTAAITHTGVTFDPASENNAASATAIVAPPQGNLVVSKEGPATSGPNEPLSYVIGWANDGDGSLDEVLVTDSLPAGVNYVSSEPEGVYDPEARTVTWTLGELAPGAEASATIVVTPPDPLVPGSQLVNQVVGTTSTEQDASDDGDEVSTLIVEAPPGLELTLGGSGAHTLQQPSTFTATLENTGSNSVQVIVDWKLPPGFVVDIGQAQGVEIIGGGTTITIQLTGRFTQCDAPECGKATVGVGASVANAPGLAVSREVNVLLRCFSIQTVVDAPTIMGVDFVDGLGVEVTSEAAYWAQADDYPVWVSVSSDGPEMTVAPEIQVAGDIGVAQTVGASATLTLQALDVGLSSRVTVKVEVTDVAGEPIPLCANSTALVDVDIAHRGISAARTLRAIWQPDADGSSFHIEDAVTFVWQTGALAQQGVRAILELPLPPSTTIASVISELSPVSTGKHVWETTRDAPAEQDVGVLFFGSLPFEWVPGFDDEFFTGIITGLVDNDVVAATNVESRLVYSLPAPIVASPLPGETCADPLVIRGVARPDAAVFANLGEPLPLELARTGQSFGGSDELSLLPNWDIVVWAVANGQSSPEVTIPLSWAFGGFDPQTSWIQPRGDASQRARFRDGLGRLTSENFTLRGGSGFASPDVRLSACPCLDDDQERWLQVVADGVVYNAVGRDGADFDFQLGATHDLSVRSVCCDEGALADSYDECLEASAEEATESSGVVLIDPDGYIVDSAAVGGETLPVIEGATATCQWWDDSQQAWLRWPAEIYESQINPQIVDGSGYFAFFTPAGFYHIDVAGPDAGWQRYRSTTVEVIDTIVHVNVPYSREWEGPPDHIIEIRPTGLFAPDGSPADGLQIDTGALVEWRVSGTFADDPDTLAALTANPQVRVRSAADAFTAPNGFDSGMLAPGQRWRWRFDTPGVTMWNSGVGFGGVIAVGEAVSITDIDGDGIIDALEWGPNGGDASWDGNGDGTPDGEQASVASLPTCLGGYATVSTDLGRLAGVANLPNPSPLDTPAQLALPWCTFSVRVVDLPDGATAHVGLQVPEGDGDIAAVWQRDPEVELGLPHWFDRADATLDGRSTSVPLVDGGTGDAGQTVNGEVQATLVPTIAVDPTTDPTMDPPVVSPPGNRPPDGTPDDPDPAADASGSDGGCQTGSKTAPLSGPMALLVMLALLRRRSRAYSVRL